MARGLDHIVHAVRDLDALAEFYRKLGFTVGARNRHAWGTHNHIVQLPGFFVELLTVGEPEKLGDDGFSTFFGRRNQRFIDQHDGLSLLILESHDAKKDAADFAAAGIGISDVLRFERAGKRPDGSEVTVAFSLAFAADEGAPECGFAVCQQHFPENFWNPAFQTHVNGVTEILGLVMVAENPSDHHIFLSAFTGERELQSSSSGVSVTTPRGDIQIMDPRAYSDHFDVVPTDVSQGLRLGALRFGAPDIAVTQRALRVPAAKYRERLIVGPDQGFGAALIFEPAG